MQNSFHATSSLDFLGMRQSRRGPIEIVYDDGAARRLVWQVSGQGDDTAAHVTAAMRAAVDAMFVLPTLYTELENRAVTITRL